MDQSQEVSLLLQRQTKDSPSAVSMRSMTPPPEYSNKPASPLSTSQTSGFISLRSINPPPVLSKEPGTERSNQTSSFISLRSIDPPPAFSKEPGTERSKLQPPHNSVSHRSRTPSPEFSNEPESASKQCLKRHSENLDQLVLSTALSDYKEELGRRCDSVTEGLEGAGDRTSLLRIYTELYITHSHNEEDRTQHELTRLQAKFGTRTGQQEIPIRCQDIFISLPFDQKPIRVVLTSGVAGVGKTFSVLKFCLDWVQGSKNQILELVVLLSFRELNLARGESYSLLKLIHDFHPNLLLLSAQTLLHSKVLFIFDGLDESRLHLDFNCEVISGVTQSSEIGRLLVNLIRGNMLPDALIWITSRPAAASRVPVYCVDRRTEVRGFRDSQKEEYFSKRFSDEQQRRSVLSHITASHSLYTMCQIPVFCWITATVLDHMLRLCQSGPLPQTLTDMYAHFLLVQTQRTRKYRSENAALEIKKEDCKVLLKLGKLAFDHLHNGNLIFYQEDLQEVGLDLTEASVYSGLCTEILIEENIIFEKSVYCFVHLSVQEFLAAVYMLHCFNHKMTQEISSFLRDWEENMPLDVFLQKSIEKSFKNESGRLDLFVRFLHGLLLESNQRLLRALLGQVQTDSQMIQKITQNLTERNAGGISAPGSITVFYCLTEMNDQKIHQRILHLLKTEFESDLSEFYCVILAHKLQMPQEVLQELHIKRFRTMPDGKVILVPPDTCREATILWNGLSREHAAVIASALKSFSQLKRLDLWLRDRGAVEAFCEGLRDPHCRLETLSLHHSRLSELSCGCLVSALKSNPAHLRKLDLSWNEELQEPGLRQICTYLQSPDCHLHILRLENCRLGEGCCLALSSALALNPHHLRELDVTENQLSDAGVEHFCEILKMPHLSLEHLRLDNCGLSEVSCSSLATALVSNPESKLKKLDLSVNEVKDSGVERLCEYLRWPHCHLEAIKLKGCGLTERSCLVLASSLNVHMKDLRLNWNPDMRDEGVKHMSTFLKSQSCGLEELRFRGCGVTGIGCSYLDSALTSTPLSPLAKLDLCENNLTQSDVEKLTELQHNPQYQLEQLEWEED